MTWEQKFQAIASLLVFKGDASLHMREPGNWYTSFKGLEIKSRGTLSSIGAIGTTPEKAVEYTWDNVTKLDSDQYVVRGAYATDRRAFRWNGFMWEDVLEETN
jgi:hypothetical protein